MPTPEERLKELGLTLPRSTVVPADLHMPFVPVNVRGNRAIFSGHPKTAMDGKIAGPYGVVGKDFSTEQAKLEARKVGLTVLADLKAEIGELSRIQGWVRVFGMITSAPNFSDQHLVLNGFSDLVLDVFGPEVGCHALSVVSAYGSK